MEHWPAPDLWFEFRAMVCEPVQVMARPDLLVGLVRLTMKHISGRGVRTRDKPIFPIPLGF